MLRPHHGEDAEFGPVRLAPEQLLQALIFVRRQTVLGHDLRRDG
jgi:hypothetical protein